ncbi:winged helix-turn-helix domain-containing protein [Streptomyces sp. DH24]|uniref:winged helix-turn-helix domain-containing protein n=1 Tax=Streptomyces sp. DH24 TaxID=3040123 RepID=UPI00244237D7|nr:winged helix-turn-helix domain-containing protein [Streptomyces sp. DH24]MDG9719904.1 winged helix-turn-helix domain-containing protein [Streptomyces sp. DH24]
MFQVLTGTTPGVPAPLRALVRQSLPPSHAAAMSAVFASACWAPDALSLTRDLDAGGEAAVPAELDALEPDALLAELHRQFGDTPPARWRAAAARPREFLDAYRAAVYAVWQNLLPVWRTAEPYVRREQERIGLAAVTGTLDVLVGSLGGRARYADGAFTLPHECPHHLAELGQRRVVLVPLASGYSADTYSAERDDVLWFGYPLPGLGQVLADVAPQATTGADRLTTLLGRARAGILRSARRRPSLSETARHIGLSVSTASYHCDQLTESGLLLRQRQGQQVRLHLTERGDALLDLLT